MSCGARKGISTGEFWGHRGLPRSAGLLVPWNWSIFTSVSFQLWWIPNKTTALYLAKGTLGVVTCKFTTMSFFASYAPDKVVEVCEGNTSWDQRVTDWMSVHYTYVIRLYIMISVHPKIDPSLTHRVSSGFSHCLVIPESHNFWGSGPINIWLVVSTPLKNISQLGLLFPIYVKIKNVPKHQPDILW